MGQKNKLFGIWVAIVFMAINILCSFSVQGQSFIASMPYKQVSVGEVFKVDYIINGAKPDDPNAFSINTGADFERLPGTSNEERYEMNGNHINYQYVFKIQLIARRVGKFTLEPATVWIKGNKIKSNSLTIQVVAANQVQGDVFILLTTNKKEVFLKEGVVATYILYQLTGMLPQTQELEKMPYYRGFWVENGSMMRADYGEETYNGKRYATQIVKKDILYPVKDGELVIDALEINYTGIKGAGMAGGIFGPSIPFGMDPGMSIINKHLISNEVKLKVKPLPEAGKPADFSGMVGEAVLSAKVDQRSVKANNPVVYTLTIGGEGNITLLDAPKIKLAPDVEVFPPKSRSSVDRGGLTLSGTRTFEYTLIPHKEGKLVLPEVSFSYFDPVEKKYVSNHTQTFSIDVDKGDKTARVDTSGRSQNGRGLNFSWPSIGLSKVTLLTIGGVSLLLLGLLLVFYKKKEAINPDEENVFVEDYKPAYKAPAIVTTKQVFKERAEDYAPNKEVLTPVPEKLVEKTPETAMARENDEMSSEHIIRERMHSAGRFLESMQVTDFLNELQEAIYAYIKFKTGLNIADASTGNVRKKLQEEGMTDVRTERFIKLLQQCEFAKYAPTVGVVDAKALHQEAVSLLTLG